jgi:hypothetical protein
MTRELVSEPQVVQAKKGGHEAAAHSLAPSVAAILGLQQSAGNSVVARLVAEGAPPRELARKGDGWGDARPGGWNERSRRVGTTIRIPLEGLSGGLADDDKRKSSSEGAAHKAIAIVPDVVDWSSPVDVLLHFHGFGSGYRESTEKNQETPAGAVRDVEESEIEQQLASTGLSMVAILPQGTGSSGFSVADPAAYVGDAFKKMLDHLVITADAKPGRIVISGHSGGGVAATSSSKALQAQAGADETQWLAASPLFLFDAINGTGELGNVRNLLDGWLAEDIKILAAAGPRAADLVGKRGVRFHSTWHADGGVYQGTNTGGDWIWEHWVNNEKVETKEHVAKEDSVEGHLKWLFETKHKAELAPLGADVVAALRGQYKVEGVGGSHNFTVGTGEAPKSRTTDLQNGPTEVPGEAKPSIPDYTPGTGHLEEALDELPGAKKPAAAAATRGKDAALSRSLARTRRARAAGRTLARQPVPPAPPDLTLKPDAGADASSCPVATPEGQPTESPYQPALDALAALRTAEDALKAAAGGPARTRRAAKSKRDDAQKAYEQAVGTLATMLRENLPPKFMLDGYLARTDVDDAAKVQTIGLLAIEVERMEFLLGRLFYRGKGTWETGGANKGPFPDLYRATVGGSSGEAWCTKFSGYARSRLGFHAAPGSATTSMFNSGWRFQHWSETGKTLGGTGENQTTAADQTVASGAGGSALIETDDWKKLTRDLTKARHDANKAHADEAAARQAVTEAFLAAHPHPQPGDLVIKTRGSGGGNDYSGGESHTMMIERAEGHFISTIEGNRSDSVGGRKMDLTDPADTGQIIFLSRLGTQFFGDPATQAPETAGIGGMISRIVFSEALLVGLMQAANARLLEIDSAAGFVGSSDPNASVADWEEADAAPAHAGAAAEN